MRKSFIIPLMLLSFFVAANCNAQAIVQHGSKTLVAYFSGTGTTQRGAYLVAQSCDGDLYLPRTLQLGRKGRRSILHIRFYYLPSAIS